MLNKTSNNTSNIEIAEVAKAIVNVQIHLNITSMNEFSDLYLKIGFNTRLFQILHIQNGLSFLES